MVSAIHYHEFAIGIHVFHLPPHSILPGCYRAQALGALHHTSKSNWLSILHMVMYVSLLFSQIIPPSPSPTGSKIHFFFFCYVYVSFAALHVVSSIPSSEIPYLCIPCMHACMLSHFNRV